MTKIDQTSCCTPPNKSEIYTIADQRISILPLLCNGCGICEDVCPFGLPQKTESGRYHIELPELCTECSACERNCPNRAIIMQEKQGCGCLWDVRQRLKNGSLENNSNCC